MLTHCGKRSIVVSWGDATNYGTISDIKTYIHFGLFWSHAIGRKWRVWRWDGFHKQIRKANRKIAYSNILLLTGITRFLFCSIVTLEQKSDTYILKIEKTTDCHPSCANKLAIFAPQ